MDSPLDRLAQDADRARRLLSGVNDARSIRTLVEFADHADRQLAEARMDRSRDRPIAGK